VKATLLVGDLRNFTALSARLSAEQVAAMLREWYADCERILKPRGAIIDKFIGDGVFAYWAGDSAEVRAQATEAARLLSGPAAGDSPVRTQLREQMNLEVHCHIGMNIGDVALGAMGRGVNTAVGEEVNVTFRIESLTRTLQVPVLVSAAFIQGWPDGLRHYRPAGIHPVKGQPEPVEVYALHRNLRPQASACSRSAHRSSTCSMPTENRTRPSVTPTASRTAFGTEAWVMLAGWQTSDSMPPRLSAWVNSRRRRMKASASSKPWPKSASSMPEPARIWRLASSCCGCEGRKG